MRLSHVCVVACAIITPGLIACGGGGGGNGPVAVSNPPVGAAPGMVTGTMSVALTDGPMQEARSLVLHVTHLELGHADGSVIRVQPNGGPLDLDMMQFQNGVTHNLLDRFPVPAGEYEWMRLGIDPARCYIDLQGTGGRHGLEMGIADGLIVHHPFVVPASDHVELILDYDLRLGVRHYQMGMMGDRYELHPALRLMYADDAGGLMGTIHASLVDVNHPACDPAEGGNWAYLFPGHATMPDDIADAETDDIPGPIATDRVEMDIGTGQYHYHFAFLPAGSYRVAFSCAGDWEEMGDNDYPADPDGQFDFQAFSGPTDVIAGEMHVVDLNP